MKKNSKQKKERLGINWIFWIALIVVLVPCGLFGYLLYTAYQEGSTPILGNRFLGDLDPAIEEASLTKIQQDVLEIDGVEKASINCIVATVRITVDVIDGASAKEINEIAEKVYNVVDAQCPISTYFTSAGQKKMYDLEVNVFNNLEYEDNFIMVNLVKNGPMKKYIIQEVTTPINAELAKELWAYVEERDAEREAEKLAEQEENQNEDDEQDENATGGFDESSIQYEDDEGAQ